MTNEKPSDSPASSDGPAAGSERRYWLDGRLSHNLIVGLLVAACFAVVAVDFFHDQHGHFDYERWNGFHAAFGFVAYVCIVQTAKILREFVQREEDYYGE